MVPARMVKRFRPSSYSAELCSAAGTRVISLILLMMLLALGAAGLQRSAQSAQQSEYEGHCYAGSLDRRPTSSVATNILANDRSAGSRSELLAEGHVKRLIAAPSARHLDAQEDGAIPDEAQARRHAGAVHVLVAGLPGAAGVDAPRDADLLTLPGEVEGQEVHAELGVAEQLPLSGDTVARDPADGGGAAEALVVGVTFIEHALEERDGVMVALITPRQPRELVVVEAAEGEGGPGPERHVEARGAVVAVEGEVGDAGDERCRESRGGQEEALACRHRPVAAVVEEAGLREQHPASTVARRR